MAYRGGIISCTSRHDFLDTWALRLADELGDDPSQLTEVLESERRPARRRHHEGIRIPPVGQRPVDGPQPPVVTAEVQSVLTPIPMRVREPVALPTARMERVFDHERVVVIAFLDKRCS